jgi:hypothetical protein
MEKLSCAQAKQIDLVDYLASLGHNPHKVNRDDYWYLSPFRDEKTPSFKVNRKLNVWFDFGEGKGGDLINFGTRYLKCTVNELLEKLRGCHPAQTFSFQPPSQAGEKKDTSTGKILILDDRRLAATPLLQYLQKRCIPVEIAEQFCREVDFLLYEKKYTAIGFKNDSGGYELRNQFFKGSSSPKDITFLNHGQQKNLAVFEGFFNYLSFHSIRKNHFVLTNFLVLNSASFFEKSREKMEAHQEINLFLDTDPAGKKLTQLALQWDKGKYIDRSHLYQNQKDLNEWLVHKKHQPKQSHGIRRHF